MNIDEKIIKATKFEDSNMLTEAMGEISLKISEAINPVSRISAPFAVFCLREYADAIETWNYGREGDSDAAENSRQA